MNRFKWIAIICITIIVCIVVVATTITKTLSAGAEGAIDGTTITGGISAIVSIAMSKLGKDK